MKRGLVKNGASNKILTGLIASSMCLPGFGMSAAVAGENSGFLDFEDRLMVRLRAIAVVPEDDAKISLIGGDTNLSVEYAPELDITYFFTDNIAAELIAASPKHDVEAFGTALGTVDLGAVRLLPPTLTLQYHFYPQEGIKPYIGAGINYTWFYDVDEPAGFSIDYDDSFGFAIQAGIDIEIKENMYFNIDVKKLWLDTDVSIDTGPAVINADVDINPLIVGVGFGIRF